MINEAVLLERLKAGANKNALLPFSTLVVAMGDHWEPGAKDSIMDMRTYSREVGGIECEVVEEMDRCYNWGDALGSMRNMGYRRAMEGGFQNIMYVDNDVIVPKHTLVQLLGRYMPIIAPRIVYADGKQHGLNVTKLEPGNGIVLAGSCVLTCILFRAAIFYEFATHDFWGNAIGDDEEYHFTKLAMMGHYPFIDTDVTVTCLKPPHFPLDKKRTPEQIAARENNSKEPTLRLVE